MSKKGHREVIEASLERAKHYFLTRNYGRAFAHFMVVFRLSPDLLSNTELNEDCIFCLAQVGQQLENQNKISDLLSLYGETLELFPTNTKLHINLASHLMRLELWEQATHYLRCAIELDPSCETARHLFDNVSNSLIERWHFPMLNCKERNTKFNNAIGNAIARGHNVVLDIGTGTGILSMFAVNKGALKTYACEMSTHMYKMAQTILKANAMDEKVKLFHKKSTDLTVSSDMEERVSLVVTETFDAALFGEHVLETLTHAWDNLLLPRRLGGLVVPMKAVVWASIIESKTMRDQHRATFAARYGREYGHENLVLTAETADNDYSTERLSELKGGYRNMCCPQQILTVDFNDVEGLRRMLQPLSFTFDVCCDKNGFLDAVAIWFDLHLDGDNVLSTDPASSTCWEQALFPLVEDLEVTKDDCVRLEVEMEGSIKKISCTILPPTTRGLTNSPASSSDDHRIEHIPNDALTVLNDQVYMDALSETLLRLCDRSEKTPRTLVSAWATTCALQVAQCVSGEVTCLQNSLNSHIIRWVLKATLPKVAINAETEEAVISKDPKWNVLVTQFVEESGLLNNEAICEAALLKESVLAPSFSIIPFAIQCWAVLIQSPTLLERNRVCSNERTLGLKIAEFMNYYQVLTHQDVELTTLPHDKLSDPFHVLEMNFSDKSSICAGNRSGVLTYSNTVTTPIQISGSITAIVYWFVIRLSADLSVSTLDPHTHWRQAAIVLREAVPVQSGLTVEVTATVNKGFLNMSLHCKDNC